ncbi:hypothetical protein PG990_008215 [Apiospora arundinis]
MQDSSDMKGPEGPVGSNDELLPVAEQETFHLFSKLPPEIRHTIFFLALEHNHVNLQSSTIARLNKVFSPPPPAIASVCRESRLVTLRAGSPHAINDERRAFNSCWFQPSLDLLILPPYAPLKITNNYFGFTNRVCATSVLETAERVAVRLYCISPTLSSNKAQFLQRALELPKIKHLYISLGTTAHGEIPQKTTLDFGNSSHKIVPFDNNEEEVNRLVATLSAQDVHSDSFAATELNEARHTYLDHTIGKFHQRKWFQTEVLSFCERVWAERQFQNYWVPEVDNEDDAAKIVRVRPQITDGKLTNRNHPFIKRALETMPKIEAVYVLEAPTHEKDKEKTHFRTVYEPEYIFNHEFKLWQKVNKRQMWGRARGQLRPK